MVEVQSVTKVYQPYPLWMRALARSAVREPVIALDGVSTSVSPGDMCVVIGPNGAGKSTLFRILTGLTTPSSGSASIMGRDVTHESPVVRRMVGFMPADDRTLLLRNTCRENLDFHGRLQGITPSALPRRIDDALELVGLTHAQDRTGHALSSGMKARLQLARAILHEPSVLILDEPTGSVDPMGAHELLEAIVAITRERRLATLISSHRLEEIEALKDNVVLLDEGRIVFSGDLEAIRTLWETPRFRLDFGNAPSAQSAEERLATRPYASRIERDGMTVVLSADVPVGLLISHLHSLTLDLTSFETERISLRELLDSAIVTARTSSIADEG